MRLSLLPLLALLGTVSADSLFAFNSSVQVESRSLDRLHQAALAEGGTVVLWHGGDLANGGDDLKKSFEARFPGVTLNVTIDLSKYHDGRVDQALASGGSCPTV
jgi:hypothetical protein